MPRNVSGVEAACADDEAADAASSAATSASSSSSWLNVRPPLIEPPRRLSATESLLNGTSDARALPDGLRDTGLTPATPSAPTKEEEAKLDLRADDGTLGGSPLAPELAGAAASGPPLPDTSENEPECPRRAGTCTPGSSIATAPDADVAADADDVGEEDGPVLALLDDVVDAADASPAPPR